MVSVIIPVYNNWHLTSQCLKSLAETTQDEHIEVIVIDNASIDQTQAMCKRLGSSLFPERFSYIRQNVNKNYAYANNLGALQAKGEYLFLLNNDTILLENWLPPLREAMSNDSSLGAIGPILLYPQKNNNFYIQHIGVAVSLNKKVTHLYENLQYKHKLIQKKRFFQIITGASLFIKRSKYLEMKGFNENFINGFEDIEFCYRLTQDGFRQTVIPNSVIIHYGSQSVGRNDHNEENGKLCARLCPKIVFDEANFFRDDGYCAIISPWDLSLEPRLPAKKELMLLSQVKIGNIDGLRQAFQAEPFWSAGAIILAKKLEESGKLNEAFEVLEYASHLHMTPDILIPFYYFLQRHKQTESLSIILDAIQSFKTDESARLDALHNLRDKLITIDDELVSQTDKLIHNNKNFFRNEYQTISKIID